MKAAREPQTLQEAILYFSDPENCLAYLVPRRWSNGITCPVCGSANIGLLRNQMRWQCNSRHPRRQFSVKVGTIFEDSPLGLNKWLPAVWMLQNSKNGISSHEVARALGVTQKTAWFMLHRIRLAMQSRTFSKIGGNSNVEADETFIGGKARFMHKSRRERAIKGTGGMGKAAVMGLLERHGPDGHSPVILKHVPNVRRRNLTPEIHRHVEMGAEVFTDSLPS